MEQADGDGGGKRKGIGTCKVEQQATATVESTSTQPRVRQPRTYVMGGGVSCRAVKTNM